MAALRWMQRAQQNEGTAPALICCCCLIEQEYVSAEHQLLVET